MTPPAGTSRARAPAALLGAVLLLSACGSLKNSTNFPTPQPSGPSGSLGVVTLADARAAVEGLCEMQTTYAHDVNGANGTFYDKAHEELHVIAAATEPVDRVAAAQLLQAKEKVENDLLAQRLPSFFVHDVKLLTAATLAALKAIGLDVPGCA